MPTVLVPAADFQRLAEGYSPRFLGELLGVDQATVRGWLAGDPAAAAVPQWACRLVAAGTGRPIAASVRFRTVAYATDPDATAWMIRVEGLRDADNRHEDPDALDGALSAHWFGRNGAFILPTAFMRDGRLVIENGRHRLAVLFRYLAAVPVGVIGDHDENGLWPLAVRRMEPGEPVPLPDLPVVSRLADFHWKPAHSGG